MKNISSVSKWPFQHTKMAILRKWGYVLKWPFWGNGGMVANSANIGAFYTILTNIWHPWRSWVRLHMEVQLELWEKFESNLLVCLNLSGSAKPNWPQRGGNQKFGSDNDVWSQKLNFFTVKNPLQIQFEKKNFAVPCVLLNLDGLWVQQVSYMKLSVNIRWDRVCLLYTSPSPRD